MKYVKQLACTAGFLISAQSIASTYHIEGVEANRLYHALKDEGAATHKLAAATELSITDIACFAIGRNGTGYRCQFTDALDGDMLKTAYGHPRILGQLLIDLGLSSYLGSVKGTAVHCTKPAPTSSDPATCSLED